MFLCLQGFMSLSIKVLVIMDDVDLSPGCTCYYARDMIAAPNETSSLQLRTGSEGLSTKDFGYAVPESIATHDLEVLEDAPTSTDVKLVTPQ